MKKFKLGRIVELDVDTATDDPASIKVAVNGKHIYKTIGLL